MKTLFKIAIVIALAKLIVSPPAGIHPYVDAIAEYSVKDLAVDINSTVTHLQNFVTSRL